MDRPPHRLASYTHTTVHNGQSKTVEAVLVDNVLKERVYENGQQVYHRERPYTERPFAEEAPMRLVDLRRAINRKVHAVGVIRRCTDDARVGEIRLTNRGDVMRITVHMDDAQLQDGLHGFHLHRCGDERNPDKTCGSMCEHYAREKTSVHGGLRSAERHEGDLGNVESVDGIVRAKIHVSPDQLTLEECYGRAFIVHEGEDDLGMGGDEESLVTGNAGRRHAYAIVGRL